MDHWLCYLSGVGVIAGLSVQVAAIVAIVLRRVNDQETENLEILLALSVSLVILAYLVFCLAYPETWVMPNEANPT